VGQIPRTNQGAATSVYGTRFEGGAMDRSRMMTEESGASGKDLAENLARELLGVSTEMKFYRWMMLVLKMA
jgi:hypothetical protein